MTSPTLTGAPWRRLLAPASMALVGASERNAFHAKVVHNNGMLGYRGSIVPVNPKRATAFGLPCAPSLSALDEPVDVAVVSVAAQRVLDVVEEGVENGVRAFVVNTAGLGEAGGAGLEIQRRVARTCRDHGALLVGPNCLGLVDLYEPVALYGAEVPGGLRPGDVGLVAQSGSATIVMMSTGRSFGYSLIASTGNEAVVTTEDLLEVLADDPRTRVIALFLEGLRDGRRFRAAVARAHEQGKSVVVLKVGTTEGSRRIVESHTGAMAGDARVTEAVFRDLGVVMVRDYDELCEVLTLLTSSRSSRVGSSVGVVAFSGGELSLVTDRAADHALTLPPVERPTAARVRTSFGMTPDEPVHNPFDVGASAALSLPLAERFGAVVSAMADDDAIETVVAVQDAQHSFDAGQVDFYRPVFATLAEVAANAAKPVVLVSNLNADIHPELLAAPAAAGVPVLRGTSTALRAVAAVAARNVRLATHHPSRPVEPADGTTAFDRWSAKLAGAAPTELDLRELLVAYGVDVAGERLCHDAAGAAAAFGEFDGPVALKVVSPDLAHKSDVGGVVLDVTTAEDAARAYTSIVSTVAQSAPDARVDGVMVSPMVGGGTEVVLGGFVDPVHGPMVMVGAGGVLVELLDDVAFSTAPVAPARAVELVRATRFGRLLDGFRGRGPLAVGALADAVAGFSRLVADGAHGLASIEVNPVVVDAERAVAVDAAAVLAEPEQGGEG